jgi:glycosyltransferase involved in cell wall biosynthesis
MNEPFSDWNVAIVKHTYTPTGGAEQELLRYVLPKAKSVTYISHPFADARGVDLNTKVSIFEGGLLKDEFPAPLVKGPFPLLAVKDILYTLWYLRKMRRHFHLYVGVDCLNALSGILLRRLGYVQRVIYYVIDYAPERFRSRPAQELYRMLDRWCCCKADAIWNVSAAMENARKSHGLNPERCAPQIEVPLGNRYNEIPKPDSRSSGLIVFLGSLTKEQGVNVMLDALPIIKRRIPAVRLRIIGDGPELGSLRQLAEKNDVNEAVEFCGFIEEDAQAAALAAEGVVAVAPYVSDGGTYKRFADPGKVKIYLAAGLPVVISRVPPVAELIERAGAGIAVEEPSAERLAEAVTHLLETPALAEQMRGRALELGKSFDWTGIFDRAFAETFQRCGMEPK